MTELRIYVCEASPACIKASGALLVGRGAPSRAAVRALLAPAVDTRRPACLEEARALGQLLNGVATVPQDTRIAVDVGDCALAGGGVDIPAAIRRSLVRL